jgi:hypothetical protein
MSAEPFQIKENTDKSIYLHKIFVEEGRLDSKLSLFPPNLSTHRFNNIHNTLHLSNLTPDNVITSQRHEEPKSDINPDAALSELPSFSPTTRDFINTDANNDHDFIPASASSRLSTSSIDSALSAISHAEAKMSRRLLKLYNDTKQTLKKACQIYYKTSPTDREEHDNDKSDDFFQVMASFEVLPVEVRMKRKDLAFNPHAQNVASVW